MIVGLHTIGDSIIQSNLPTSIDNKFYYIELKNGIFDELYISQDSNITNTSKLDWVLSTYFKATFKNHLEAGNVGLSGLQIDKWKVRRRVLDSVKFKELNIIGMGVDENFYYLDTSPRANIIYEYEVIPMSGDIEGNAHVVQYRVSFDYWWLTDTNNEETYPFFANIEVSDINNNIQRHVYDGFDEFPTTSYGKQKYQSGTITAILLDAFVETNKNYRDKVVSFLSNRKRKYMKNPYGDIWVVDTYVLKRNIFEGFVFNMGQQQTSDISSVTFEWQEVARYEE